jgi:transposase-like protein
MAKRRQSGEREVFWRDVVARFGTSGLSVRAFCRREKLHESAFYFWRRTLAERDPPEVRHGGTSKRTAVQPTFLPVTIRREASSRPAALSLELPSGSVLRFGETMPIERVAELIRALEPAACREPGRTEART